YEHESSSLRKRHWPAPRALFNWPHPAPFRQIRYVGYRPHMHPTARYWRWKTSTAGLPSKESWAAFRSSVALRLYGYAWSAEGQAPSESASAHTPFLSSPVG